MRSTRTFSERVETVGGYKFISLKSGRRIMFWDALDAAKSAHTDLGRALSRAFKLTNDGYDLERLEWFVDHLEAHVGALRAEIARRRGTQAQEERIALLRNTAGRTPAEAQAFSRKADQLEQRLREAS